MRNFGVKISVGEYKQWGEHYRYFQDFTWKWGLFGQVLDLFYGDSDRGNMPMP